ncbi:MAG: hypothetical protein WC307_01895 [Candidatus Nanoarchaeia archaeon]|jgi:hypothetical protein
MYDYLGHSCDANVIGVNRFNFVTDECVPKYVSESLMEKGYSVLSIMHNHFFGWSDGLIAFLGIINNSTLITCDDKFSKHYPGKVVNFDCNNLILITRDGTFSKHYPNKVISSGYYGNLDDVISAALSLHGGLSE